MQTELCILDLEATGTDPNKDRIVQIAILRVLDLFSAGGPTFGGWYETLINPGCPIPKDATDVHKITDDQVASCPPFQAVAVEIAGFLGTSDVAGYNLEQFDVPMLKAEFARAGVAWPSPSVRILDAFRIYRTQEPKTLAKAHEFYVGKEMVDAHDAKADVKATFKVLRAQLAKYKAASLDEAIALGRNANDLDSTGKLRRKGDTIIITFGKHRDRALSAVPRDYLGWCLRQNFPEDFKQLIETFLRGGKI